MVHHRQSLPLGLEPRDHLAGIHPRLDDLQGNFTPHRLELLGHVHDAHAPFADLLKQLVVADGRAGDFDHLLRGETQGGTRGGRVQKTPHPGLQF